MKKLLILAVFLFVCPTCFAQLTTEQKLSDFKALVGLYDKNYGPYDWKKQAFGFDLLDIQPWLVRVALTRNDLDFYDVCLRYVAGLNDSHDEFTLPSEYEAFLPLTADIYDNKVLIDFVDDPASLPVSIGDELVSVDGISMQTWINTLGVYSVNGNGSTVSRNRLAVATTLDRFQGWYTFASRVQPGDTASLVIRGQNGKTSTFTVPWATIFLPLFSEGPVPNPRSFFSFAQSGHGKGAFSFHSMRDAAKAASNPWGISAAAALHAARSNSASRATPAVSRTRRLRQSSVLHATHPLAGGLEPFGSFFPAFNPPPGFSLRLGAGAADEFLSGTFRAGASTVGFIRIPSFEPGNEGNAVAQFQNEMSFFQANTSALVIDLMNNGGGDLCYTNLLLQSLIPNGFRSTPAQIRATEGWLEEAELSLFFAEIDGASQDTIDALSVFLNQVQTALAQNRGNTPPADFVSPAACFGFGGTIFPPATDASGNNIAFAKPVLVLTNNFTLSAAEFFAATLQDAKRITTFGTRTDGGGGNVVSFGTAPYAEGNTRVTESIAVRNHNTHAPGLPTAPFIENLGVQPDITADFQTRNNLLTGGQPFINSFVAAIQSLIANSHP